MRRFLCALIALTIFAAADTAFARPQEKKPVGQQAIIREVDGEKGVVTFATLTSPNQGWKDLKVTIEADAKITILDGEGKKEQPGKEGLKNENFTPGAYVTLMMEKGKVVEIVLVTKKEEAHRRVAQLQDQIEQLEANRGGTVLSLIQQLDAQDQQVEALKKQLEAMGGKCLTEAAVVKKVDAEQGVVTVTVKPANGEEGKDLDITIDANTKVAIDGEEKQGKEGLKNEKLKEGAAVKIKKDKEGKIVAIVSDNTEALREMVQKLQQQHAKKIEPAHTEEAVQRARKLLELQKNKR